jgi:2-keto-4-pentenoate hydratase/2-oxohepta-3-ene-1,7-dioic acid hydratase in catechol pathway
MKLCRFTHPGLTKPRDGVIERDSVSPLTSTGDFFGERDSLRTETTSFPLNEVRLLAPVSPSKIVCVGRNYLEHAAELGNKLPDEPLLFLKAPTSLIGPDDVIRLPAQSQQVEHEGELGVVIGRLCSRIGETEDPLAYVLGYTCVNDVTARDLQRKDVQFTRAKSFDTFCPVGPFIETALDPLDVLVTTTLNGETKQRARTSAMAFSVPFLVRYISHAMTLLPGDVIATGTPAGVSRMETGDVVEVEVENIGILRNTVESQNTV